MIVITDYGDLRVGITDGVLTFELQDNSRGAVCDSGFDSNAVKVACTQLGYDRGSYDTE